MDPKVDHHNHDLRSDRYLHAGHQIGKTLHFSHHSDRRLPDLGERFTYFQKVVDKKTLKKGCISITVVLALMLATPFMSSTFVTVQTADQIYESVEEIPQKEVGLVLGAAAYGDRLSDILRDRVDTSIELYEAKKISALIMSGSAKESSAMKKYAVENGIPEEAVIEDITGLNTMASVKNAAKLNRSLIIVTQKYHLPRALYIANTKGIDAIGMTADKHTYIKIGEFKSREILATSKAILDIFILN